MSVPPRVAAARVGIQRNRQRAVERRVHATRGILGRDDDTEAVAHDDAAGRLGRHRNLIGGTISGQVGTRVSALGVPRPVTSS